MIVGWQHQFGQHCDWVFLLSIVKTKLVMIFGWQHQSGQHCGSVFFFLITSKTKTKTIKLLVNCSSNNMLTISAHCGWCLSNSNTAENVGPDNIVIDFLRTLYKLLSFQHIWTPDVIIHDLVKFNKPEILNQVINSNSKI